MASPGPGWGTKREDSPPPLEGGGWGEGLPWYEASVRPRHQPLPPTPSLKGRGRMLRPCQVGNEPISPRIKIVPPHDREHRGVALAAFFARHGQAAVQCRC